MRWRKSLAFLVTVSMLLSLTSGAALAGQADLSGSPSEPEPADVSDSTTQPEAAPQAEPEKAPTATAERISADAEPSLMPASEAAGRPGLRQYMVELEAPSGIEVLTDASVRGLRAADVNRITKEHINRLEKAQQSVIQNIKETLDQKAKVLYQVQNVLNGIAVQTDAAGAERIRQLPGVKSVSVMELHERNNSYSVPFIGTPAAWEDYGVLGDGIKIAVIDSGIDYLHTNFGGPGTPEAYALDTTTLNEYFPNVKVAGGWDFAGDDYDGYNEPQPDPNPLDCAYELGGGHGTHVAGTIAGYGVNADGTTYRGPYDASMPFDSLRIGPGVAPLAQLYSLRVFGCDGSTGLTVAALDWVVDPNGDGDYSDRMDVVNLSLGSSFGHADDASARAANNAALAGVLLAISAGNSGDVFYISGSPGSATRALTVAAQTDAQDVVDGFRVDAPAAIAGMYGGSVGQNYNWAAMAAPVTAPVVYDESNAGGCEAWPAGYLDGKIVLVDWVPAGYETFPCGSAVRANNATAAGAVGIIMAESGPFLTTAIAGNGAIPSILTNSTAGQAIKSQLDNGVTVTFSNEWLGTGKITDPSRNDTLASFSSRGPRKGNALKPDIAAPGYSIFSAQSGSGSLGVSFNGTSMAAPHMTGVLALLREKNPSWSVEEVKALAMNTAGHDLYADMGQSGARYNQARVGAGRVDVAAAIDNKVVAYSADDPGAVSVSFGAVEVLGSATFERTVKVVNHSGSTVTYRPSVDMTAVIPGLQYSFPDGDVTVPAGRSATFRVRLEADASLMRATHDPTVAEIQNSRPRQWIPEHTGVILLEPVTPAPGATATLRVPVYVTARPAADVSTVEESLTFAGDSGFDVLNMTGTGLATGGFSKYDYNALVTPFELAHVGSVATLDQAADIPPSAIPAVLQYAGITTDSRAVRAAGLPLYQSDLYFGIVAHADWSTPASEVYYVVEVRPKGSSTTYYVYNSRNAVQSGGSITYYDVMLACVTAGCYTNTNGLNPEIQSGVFNNNVMIFPVPVTYLGLSNFSTKFDWRVVTEHYYFGEIDVTPWYEYDYANPGLDFTGGYLGQPTYLAEPGKALPVGYDRAAYEAAESKGILLLHNFNAGGNRAQVIGINSEPAALAFADAPATKTYGDAPFGLAVTNEAATIGSLTQGICSVGPTVNGVATVTPLTAGDCVVRAQFAGDETTAPTFVDATIKIQKADLVVTPNSVTRAFGQANPELTGTVTGVVDADEGLLTFQYSTTATPESPAGTYPITVTIVDNKGRLPNYNVTINEAVLTIVDESGPTISATVTPEANVYGWHKSDVVVNFQCEDLESGIAECSDPVTLTEEGKDQTVTGYAVSNTGVRAETSVTVSIDKTAPTWAANSQLTASQVTGSSVQLSWNGASDGLSGISRYEVYSGDELLASVPGTSLSVTGLEPDTAYSFTVVAVDKAGNAAGGPVANVRTGGLTFLPPFDGNGEAVLPATGFDIQFKWLVNGVETENPSATVRVLNAETGAVITSFLMSAGISYADGIYTLTFNPQLYGLGSGDDLIVQVFVGRKLQNSAVITLE